MRAPLRVEIREALLTSDIGGPADASDPEGDADAVAADRVGRPTRQRHIGAHPFRRQRKRLANSNCVAAVSEPLVGMRVRARTGETVQLLTHMHDVIARVDHCVSRRVLK